jgi:hypothetical protein
MSENNGHDREGAATQASAELKAILEALIFASPEPLTPKAMFKLLDSEPKEDVLAALAPAADADHLVVRGPVAKSIVRGVNHYQPSSTANVILKLPAKIIRPRSRIEVGDDHLVFVELRMKAAEIASRGRRRNNGDLEKFRFLELGFENRRGDFPVVVRPPALAVNEQNANSRSCSRSSQAKAHGREKDGKE